MRNVYTTIIGDDHNMAVGNDGNSKWYYKAFTVDTDISDALAYTSVVRLPHGKPDNFLPRDEWNKLTTNQKEALIAKRRSGRQQGLSGNPSQPILPRRKVNMHHVNSFVNLDDLIDYTVCHHGISAVTNDSTVAEDDRHKDDTLLAYMSARGKSDILPGDILRVLASQHTPSHKQLEKQWSSNRFIYINNWPCYALSLQRWNDCLQLSRLHCSYVDFSILYWTTQHYQYGQSPCWPRC